MSKKNSRGSTRSSQPHAGVPPRSAWQQAIDLHRRGMLVEAERHYRETLRLQPANFDALHLCGIVCLQTGRAEQAEQLIRAALDIRPCHAEALANLGSALLMQSRPEQTLLAYDKALEANPAFGGLWGNRGVVLQLLGRHEEAADSFERQVDLAPDADFARGNLFHARRHGCDWRDFDALASRILTGLEANRRADQPFSFLSVKDSVVEQRRCASQYASYLCPSLPPPLWRGERYSHDRIRVAYVSADFRGHIVAYFMAAICGQHDARRFETIGISLSAADQSHVAQRIQRGLGQFHEVAALDDGAAASLLRQLEADIVVDLTGFTQGCRPGLFARRPAPVHVSLLGYPATMGVPYMDYLIADTFVVPASARPQYAEQVVYLPDSFHADSARGSLFTTLSTPSRASVGLPEDAVVLCCFNNSYKLNPTFFGLWAQILRAVPGGVLWLLAERPPVQERLRTAAAALGIDARRLVFAERISYSEHLARLGLADLFLDTLPFNAGATASDALWAGVPVLTCAGESFAARMGGSLLTAVGLTQLITNSPDEYVRRAIELARQPERLAHFKQQLIASRETSPFFDAARYCRHLETAYTTMWERTQHGAPQQGFSVPMQFGP